MRKWLALSAALFIAGPPCLAQAPNVRAVIFPPRALTVAAGYTGPGDIVSANIIAWWGLRAFSLAKAGTKAANVCNSGDVNCADVNTLANGNFDVATAQGAPLNCGGAGGTCTIKNLYDQTAGSQCFGPTSCDVTNATAANRPTLIFSCLGTLPCMAFSGTQFLAAVNQFAASAQPYTFSSVCERTGGTTSFSNCLGTGAGSIQFGMSNATNTLLQFAGTVQTAAGNDNVFHAINGVFSGASSIFYTDGASTSTNPGVSGVGGGDQPTIGSGNNALTGRVAEAGAWNSTFSSGVSCASQAACLSAINTNQHSYWGF